MIFYIDGLYKTTKKIKQGESQIKKEFRSLALWIKHEYGIEPLNIFYKSERKSPAYLEVIFELKEEELSFRDKNGNNLKQRQKKVLKAFLGTLGKPEPKEADILVNFTSFEPVAKAEIVDSLIPKEKIVVYKKQFDNIWEISRFSSYITIFFYTKEQANEADKNGLKEKIEDDLFLLIKEYDLFGYFKRDTFSIYLDSKEVFDTDYQSNWYYYYK